MTIHSLQQSSPQPSQLTAGAPAGQATSLAPALWAVTGGTLFGLGLLWSGMANPERVLAFLTLGQHWNPALMLVMAGAIAVSAPLFWLARRRWQRQQPSWSGQAIDWPTATRIDRKLLLGAMLFGAGWGLAGICPGPALVGFILQPAILGFVVAMLAGMWLHDRVLQRT